MMPSGSDIREALIKTKELLMKIDPGERFVASTTCCGQNLRKGKILEIAPADDYLEIRGIKYGDYKEELLRIEPAAFCYWPGGIPAHIFGDV